MTNAAHTTRRQLRALLSSAVVIAGHRFAEVVRLEFKGTTLTVRATDGHCAWEVVSQIGESDIDGVYHVSVNDCKALLKTIKPSKLTDDLPVTIEVEYESLRVTGADVNQLLSYIEGLDIPSIESMTDQADKPGAVRFGVDFRLFERVSQALRKLNGTPLAGFLFTPPAEPLSPIVLRAQVTEFGAEVTALVMPMRI